MSKKTNIAYRDSTTGRFVTDTAQKRGDVVRERIPKPGKASTDAIRRVDQKYSKVLDRLAKR